MEINCSECGKLLKVSAKHFGRRVRCPACERPVSVPAPSASKSVADEEVWQPEQSVQLSETRSRRWLWLTLLLLIPILGVAALIVIPPLIPKDPREAVLQQYLDAVRRGDAEAAARFGVLEDFPVVSDNSRGRWLEEKESTTTAPFGPIGEFHETIAKQYSRRGEVYVRTDQTGILAKTINMRQEVKKKAEEMFNPPRKRGQSESDRLFDIAENMAKTYDSVFDIVLGGPEQESVVVTYEQLIDQLGEKLTPDQRRLLELYRESPEKWRRLMGQGNFETLREDSDFTLLESTWEMDVWLPNQSYGEPPKKVWFKLVRFQVGLVDTGWKVWSYEVR